MREPINLGKIMDDLEASLPARWADYYRFAHEFDGYAAFPNNLDEVARSVFAEWKKEGVLPEDLPRLRATLFYAARQSRFISGRPGEDDMIFIDPLVEKIKEMIKPQSISLPTDI